MIYLEKFKTGKYGIYAAITLLVIVVAIIVYKISKKFLTNELTEVQLNHITNLELNEQKVTLPQTEINSLVGKLKAAFGKYGFATDESAVYEVFEALSNRDDLLLLIKTFGVYEGHTLTEWISKELNENERKHVQSILTSKGINYTI